SRSTPPPGVYSDTVRRSWSGASTSPCRRPMAKLGEMSAVVAPLLAFGLHEALDQIGATIGPLVLKVVIAQSMDHRRGFLALLVPAVAALPTLSVAASPSASSESGNGGGLPHRLWSFSEGVLGVRVRQCAGR